jgi:hypothetical protein
VALFCSDVTRAEQFDRICHEQSWETAALFCAARLHDILAEEYDAVN